MGISHHNGDNIVGSSVRNAYFFFFTDYSRNAKVQKYVMAFTIIHNHLVVPTVLLIIFLTVINEEPHC